VVYLASPEAEWASGAVLDLNGASYLRERASWAMVVSRACQAWSAPGERRAGALSSRRKQDMAASRHLIPEGFSPVRSARRAGRGVRAVGDFGVLAELGAGRGDANPQVALGPGQADRVPVDQHEASVVGGQAGAVGGEPDDVAGVGLAVGDHEARRGGRAAGP